MLEDLWIDELKVELYEHKLNGLFGAYIHSHRIILIDSRLAPVQRRSTLMHELGHAYYGHDGHLAKWEREASLWAASQMIRFSDYQLATTIYASPVAVAHELGVLPRDVRNYRLLLQRGYNA